MKKVKCYLVKLETMRSISERCFLARAFDGSEAFIPKSQVFGEDYSYDAGRAVWISAWLLEQKELQYSSKRCAWYNRETDRFEPHFDVTFEKHIPTRVEPKNTPADASLVR